MASDVLEHIADEAADLRNRLRMLKPSGRLLVCVPAFTFLWSHHDAVNHHLRRYTSKALRAAFDRAGFVIDRASYWELHGDLVRELCPERMYADDDTDQHRREPRIEMIRSGRVPAVRISRPKCAVSYVRLQRQHRQLAFPAREAFRHLDR